MNTSSSFSQFYTLAGIVTCIGALVLTLFSHAMATIRALEAPEGYAETAVFLIAWALAMMFGLRARRNWAFTLNLIVLALASVGLFVGFFFSWHPLLLVGAVAAVACYTYYFRCKSLFPERAIVSASKALKEYTPTRKEMSARRLWRFGARIYLVVHGLIAVYLVFAGIGLILQLGWQVVGGLFAIGLGVGVFCWRLWVMDCAYENWGTRMSLWETITTGSSLAILVSGFGPYAFVSIYLGIWWVPVLWVAVASIQLFYLIASYRLRQANLAFRDYRESLVSDAEPNPA